MYYRPIIAACAVWLALIPAWAQSVAQSTRLPSDLGSEIQLARYSTAPMAPDVNLGRPLAVIATVHFPRATVQTVGDAIRHLLWRTGYALMAPDQLDASARQFLNLPLPESHRTLGPYRVDAMLRVLLGDAWLISSDELTRTVTFMAAPIARLTSDRH